MPIEAPSPDDQARVWRPSLKPEHQAIPSGSVGQNYIVERKTKRGLLSILMDYLGRPFVKILIGLSLFIVAAIVFEATINGGAWTEKAPKQKATKHRGVARPAPSD